MNESKDEGSVKKSSTAEKEEKVLDFWNRNNIFQKSLDKEAPKGEYVFYDGPPFATGLPHHGHILASTIKDTVPRYQTMQGYHVSRRWGWDTHGLPIENIVEKKLGISGKKEIEKMGIEKFNECAREQVLEYVSQWKKTIDRIGRWVDFDGSYKTMNNTFIESVWWGLKQVHEKGLLYEGERVLPYCPRCETPIANSEIAMDNSYKDISDLSVTVKFKLLDESKNDEQTFLLVWTTTPWTLPANSAAAVNPEMIYVKVKFKNSADTGTENANAKPKTGIYILAKERLATLKDEYEILEEMKGADLVGKKYEPIFTYFKNADRPNKENAWQVYAAPYVTAETGTGIVHLAPAYGEEDMTLARAQNIPYFKHVESNGVFTAEVTDFAGFPIKPKDDAEKGIDHMQTDIEIVKYLAHNEHLFSKEKIRHSYPHCHRCDSPLYYTALSAWFINIQNIKDRLLSLNENINWIPEHLKEGRFKNIVAGAPDWNISRSRYWASPLPFFRKENSKEFVVVGSREELKALTKKSGNEYFVMRHGEAESNTGKFVCSDDSISNDLTSAGLSEVQNAVQKISDKKIDYIFASPLLRTRKTAEIVAEKIGLPKENIILDERIMEIKTGDVNCKPIEEYRSLFTNQREKFDKRPPNGENLNDLKQRVGDFIYEIESKYSNKNILIVTHEYVVWMLDMVKDGLNEDEGTLMKEHNDDYLPVGEMRDFDFVPVPHNRQYELDYHRPYIDELLLEDKDGTKLTRIPEVIDCWVESGSMPFAQMHYPFENKEYFEKNSPAQFVVEYIGQTRTWFYYSHVMSTALFDKIPYENIVTTGTVLNEDGEKMSKSKSNFPDPWLMFNKYGVDAERFYLLSSPVLKSEDLNFSEKGVDEASKKIIQRLQNVISFYEMYAPQAGEGTTNASARSCAFIKSENLLDQWIVARLHQVGSEVTASMEAYEIDRATWPLLDFIDDLSTWYLRRSRDRFKDGDAGTQSACQTLAYILYETAKLLAPYTPFIAEDVYQRITRSAFTDSNKSVHLELWSDFSALHSKHYDKDDVPDDDQKIIREMTEVRRLVSLALEARTKAGMKVRQPLSELRVKSNLNDSQRQEDLLRIIADEVNVKKVSIASDQSEEIILDTELTNELKQEGDARELIRAIQSLRKTTNLDPQDRIVVTVDTDAEGKNIIETFKDEITKTAGIDNFKFESIENAVEKVHGSTTSFVVQIERI